ncbi:MAG: hypothetical protein ACHQ5A_02325 [Opitutales bacterium]
MSSDINSGVTTPAPVTATPAAVNVTVPTNVNATQSHPGKVRHQRTGKKSTAPAAATPAPAAKL